MGIPSAPNTELYTLGKGVISAAPWVGSIPPIETDFIDLGNAPDVNVEVTEEVLDHFSSRSGTRKKDKQVTIETGYTVNFVLDELALQNIKMFLKGTTSGRDTIHALSDLGKEYAMKFVSDNPVGPNQLWNFWKLKIKPNGSFSLISDDWSTLSFTAEGLADDANHVSSPYFDVILDYGDSTTTTTA